MTRINANLRASELVDKHLQGEYFEIRRVRHYKPNKSIADTKFKLGTGHVKFYSTHKATTIARVKLISQEMLKRGLTNQESVDATMQLFIEAWGDEIHGEVYNYTDAENDIVRIRIAASLQNMYNKKPQHNYNKSKICFQDAINLLDFKTSTGIDYKHNLLSTF